MTTELIPGTVADERALAVAPVADFAMTLEDAALRRKTLIEFVKAQLVDGVDCGRIPGIDKPSLYKPGAEKLCKMFALAIEQEVSQRIERWEDPGFFQYEVTVTLRDKRTGRTEAEGVGSCNSKESKYRWRNADRVCPHCGRPAIIKGREEYGGGWLCFQRKGGCGAKFRDDDTAIVGQTIGRIENPDIYDQVNTILKMAAKRALVDATLKAVGASDLFTQDLEDGALHDGPPPRDHADDSQPPQRETSKTSEPRPMQPRAQQASHTGDFKNVGEFLTAALHLGFSRPEVMEIAGLKPNAAAGELSKYQGGLTALYAALEERKAGAAAAAEQVEASFVEPDSAGGAALAEQLVTRVMEAADVPRAEVYQELGIGPADLAATLRDESDVDRMVTDLTTRFAAAAVGADGGS